jgi:hypothetical protein
MFKADYPDRAALEDELIQAAKRPRESFPLKLTTNEVVEFYIMLKDDNIVSGKTADAIGALVTIDLDTLEVTINR